MTGREIPLWHLVEFYASYGEGLIGARIARAEAAERFAKFAAMHRETGATEAVYEAAERLLREYIAARDAVRKLEEQDKGGKR